MLVRRSADATVPHGPASAEHRAIPREAMVNGTRARVAPARLAPDGGLDMQLTFGLDSAELSPRAKAEAKAFATAMAAPEMVGRQFAIEGHTDASGSRQKNVDLSQRRAQAVVDYLVSQSVDPGRLSAKGYGPDRPLPGKSASASANRRVEFVKA